MSWPTLRLAALAVLLSFATPAAAALDVYNDSGGYVIAYAAKYARASKPIRVFGNCASACTLALKYPSTCVGPRAAFRFHAATHPRATQWMIAQYPASIRSWIRAHGGLTKRLITLSGPELRARVRSCS